MEVKLIVLDGKAKGQQVPLPSTQFIIGRAPECHLRPHSPSVSKHHCAIGRAAGQVVVRDLKSRNGTFINDQRISGIARIKYGDTLSVGPLEFRFSITEEKGGREVQSIRKDHVRWLMEAAETFDMDANYETQIVELPGELLQQEKMPQPAGAADSTDDGEDDENMKMSAGKFLRDYFRRQ